MNRKVLYLTPSPPIRNGIADYAVSYKQAIEEYTDWHLEIVNQQQITGNSISDILTLYRQVKQWQTDGIFQNVALVHAEIGYAQHREFYTLFWIKRLLPHLPYCITVHDPPLVIAPALYYLSCGLNAKLIRHACRVLDYTFLGRSTIRFVLSSAACSFVLSDLGARALSQIVGKQANIQSLPHINFHSEGLLQKKKIKPISETLSILFMGFWGANKGIEILLNAFTQVVTRSKQNVKLLLAGGLLENNINQTYVNSILNNIDKSPVKAAIEVLGYIEPISVDATLQNSDIFVLPYIQSPGYSSSGVLMRAMAAGLAIVASDVGTISEEIKNLETGILVAPNDVDALAQALIRLVNEQSLRVQLSEQAQNYVFAEHSREKIATRVSDIYDKLCHQ
ncbi:group 1 glycosyl transferase [Nostoc carneum NIES-2107]|nr:group 1 glycosyl transferase [Nostoc carneum NIES-2107]